MFSDGNSSPRYLYRIDARDRIEHVNADWLRFAEDNDAPELCLPDVIGSVIWDHVTGMATQSLYRELFQRMRLGRLEVAIPFNCDSPTVVREMTLTLRSLSGGVIELEGRLNRVQSRERVNILERRTMRGTEAVAICSLCRKISLDDGWMTIEEAIGRRRWFTVSESPQLEGSLCSVCTREAS